jgi:hypothetical protein
VRYNRLRLVFLVPTPEVESDKIVMLGNRYGWKTIEPVGNTLKVANRFVVVEVTVPITY